MLLIKITISSYDYLRPGLKVIKLFPYSTQLRTKFILLISMINTTSEYLKSRKISVFQHFCFYEQLKFYTELSMKKVLQPRGLSSVSANKICVYPQQYTGAQWLSGRVLDSRPKGRGFEPHRHHCVVSLSKNINPSFILVQPRNTRPFITERVLMGRKESNQTNKQTTVYYKMWKFKPKEVAAELPLLLV